MSSFLDHVPDPPPNAVEPTLTLLSTELFDKLDGVSRSNLGKARTVTERKAEIITDFVKTFRLHIGNDMSPAAHLIFPEKSGKVYFVKEVTLARLIISMYRIPKNSEDYNLLYHWNKQYQKSKRYAVDERKIRDLPLQAARVIAKRRDFTDKFKEYTVAQVNKLLDDLSAAKSAQEQKLLLKPVLNTLRIEEIRWLIQFILKKSILTFMEEYFFNCWHAQGFRVYSICNNLQLAFNLLADPQREFTREELGLHPGFKFKPQLAERLTIKYEAMVKKMQKLKPMEKAYEAKLKEMGLEDKFYIEEKMDGDRMLLHKDGNNQFKFFSRRLKDYSFLYGESFQFGSLTKYLSNAFAANVNSVILDGEMVAYDYKRQAILPFGTLKSSAMQESVRQFTTIDQYEQQTSYPYYIVFDILYLNGKDLTNYPLFFRKDILSRIINPVRHRFEVLDARLGSDTGDIERALREVITSRSEGLLLKHTQSKYGIGLRNRDWVKVKPEYLERFGENLDLVVIGKNPGVKNSYMVSLKNAENGAYYSLAMVANGFETEEYDKIERLTHGKWHEISKGQPLPSPDIIRFGHRKPVYWIDPKDSVILEVKARSIDVRPEKTYAAGSSLHNNYCRRIREDKTNDECITLQDYWELKANYTRSLEKFQNAITKKRTRHLMETLQSFENKSELKKVKVESDLFSKFEFLIMSDKKSIDGEVISIEELKKLVKKYGGKVVHQVDPIKSDSQVLAITEIDLPVGNRLLAKGMDLVKPEWIFECVRRNSIVQIEPYFIFATRNWDYYSNRVDQFGDSYVLHTPMSEIIAPPLSKSELDTFRNQFEWEEPSKPLLYLFEGTQFHVVGTSLASELLRQRIERFNGEITEKYADAGYIVVPEWEYQSNKELTQFRINKCYENIDKNLEFVDGKPTRRIPFTVTEAFVEKCIASNCIADPEDYKYC
ncbi:uncharacterized protein LODBEIA_P45850 [Lodderomyces beijingensis]|uniref:DNA ligase n=1 Tax=Lodderomyces beijingensis TaxID=1775926 RepID=A0ABP0ZQC3_9ASCO